MHAKVVRPRSLFEDTSCVLLNLPPNLRSAAKHLAVARSMGLSDVISELALKELEMQNQPALTCKNGFPVFIVPTDGPTLNLYDMKCDELL